MSIFDVFTFKKEALKVFTAENFKAIMEKAREEIIKKAKENLPGEDKKVLVDNIVILKVCEIRGKCNNKLVIWIIDQLLKIIPTVTQLIYNFLKEKVENL